MANASPIWPNSDTPAPQPQKRIKISNASDCRIELTRLYREMRNGKLDIQDGSRLANVVMLIQRSYIETALEDRVAALESEA
ncbi:hypothetical protein [Paenirhodobacter enshiensis]|uniref:hypothetical protein n=1 Tax=Paenirhodobacter enshiensis TaxID=1105367 RepID=UPI0035AECBB5